MSGRTPVEAAGEPTPQFGQRGRADCDDCCVGGCRRTRERPHVDVAAVARTPGAATASVPARRHSATAEAGVSCGSTSPNASCTAAAAAHHASNSGPLGVLPRRAANSSAKCGTSGKAGSRTDLPSASMAPSANSGCAPAAASAVNCSVTLRPHSSSASTAPCANALCAAFGSTRPNTGSIRAPRRWIPSSAARSKLPGLAAATRARPSGASTVGRPTTIPGLAPAMTGTQWPTSNCARGSPTIQASAAWPGTNSTVCPSGAPRASNWLAPVTPSALPTSTRRIAVSGGSDCASAGNKASAQRLSAPSAGPATSSLGVSGKAAAAGSGVAARNSPARVAAGRLVSIARRLRRPIRGRSVILVPHPRGTLLRC